MNGLPTKSPTPRGRPKNSPKSLAILAGVGLAATAVSWGLNRLPSPSPALSAIPSLPAAPTAAPPPPLASETVPERAAKPRATANSNWPPPPGTPRERLFGDHFGEAITTFNPAEGFTLQLPLRRRFCDPWYRLSNARWLPGGSKEKGDSIALDVEFAGPAAQRPAVILWWYIGNARRAAFGRPPLALIKGKETVTIDNVQRDDPSGRGIEIFATHSDSTYILDRTLTGPGSRFESSGSVVFKASPSIFLGNVPHPHLARDWTPEETAALTGPPGQYEIRYTEN